MSEQTNNSKNGPVPLEDLFIYRVCGRGRENGLVVAGINCAECA